MRGTLSVAACQRAPALLVALQLALPPVLHVATTTLHRATSPDLHTPTFSRRGAREPLVRLCARSATVEAGPIVVIAGAPALTRVLPESPRGLSSHPTGPPQHGARNSLSSDYLRHGHQDNKQRFAKRLVPACCRYACLFGHHSTCHSG
ncbi:hypothetical protein IQ07DRAFT_636231 [Pyrenochaeta sp. DS3sAY3a]|nr:hypothetical protein IQ07DRAFT_636231 [Pyrenochaeta sp. DS3sAY3a]